MSKQRQHFKFNDQTLLNLLLNERGMSREQYIKWATRHFELNRAKEVQSQTQPKEEKFTPTGEVRWSTTTIWHTPKWLITTTKYGRIKDIQVRPRSVVQTPLVQWRRKRTMEPH